MVDTKTPGDKTLSVPTRTLTLKPRVETGTVRQSFSHRRNARARTRGSHQGCGAGQGTCRPSCRGDA
jgi:translation initiation factor IF-2